MRTKVAFVIDGADFSTLDEFYDQITRVLVPNTDWGRNLDAFNDILRGGFGTPPEGFIIRWRNSDLSRSRLGYPETVRQLESRLLRCHPLNRSAVTADLELARREQGPTVFDWLEGIIRAHGPEGLEANSGVELELA